MNARSPAAVKIATRTSRLSRKEREDVGDLRVRRVVDRVHGRPVERDGRDVISDLDVKVARGLFAHRVEMYNPLQARGCEVVHGDAATVTRGEHS